MLGSEEIDTIINSDMYDTSKDLYLSEKQREEKLLQGIQSANGLKTWVQAKNTNNRSNQRKYSKTNFGQGTEITKTTKENAVKLLLVKYRINKNNPRKWSKTTFGKRFVIPLDFDFFKHLCIFMDNLTVRHFISSLWRI